MKSIIIILAIILVTLTTKADWVKSGELDSLYLGDAPITFSKYSPDYTKFVTYSAKDSTLRLWNLETGKVIKERIFEQSFKFEVCEFDFDSEMFCYPSFKSEKGTYTSIKVIVINYINFLDSLKQIDVTRESNSNSNPPSFNYIDFLSLTENNSNFNIFIRSRTWYSPNGLTYEDYYGSTNILKFKNGKTELSSSLISNVSSIRNYEYGCLYYLSSNNNVNGTHGGPVNSNKYTNGINIDFGDYNFVGTATYDNTNDVVTNDESFYSAYPYFRKFNPLDIAFDNFVFNDENGNIIFFSGLEKRLQKYKINFNAKEIRNFKLIANANYSVFFKDTNNLLFYNNKNNIVLESHYMPEGKLNYDPKNKLIFSKVQNNIYKLKIESTIERKIEVWTSKPKYVIGDTVNVFKKLNFNAKDVKYEIDNVFYYDSIAKFKSNKVGYYDIYVHYQENGNYKVYKIDSLFQVKDSLKVIYKITHDFNNNAKYPFHCEAITNDTSANFKWSYSWCETTYDKTGKPIMTFYSNRNYGANTDFIINREINSKSTPLLLNISNSSQNIEYKIDVKVLPNLNITSSKFRGLSPLNFKVIFESTFITHSGFGSYYYCLNESYNKQLIIGNDIVFNKPGNSIDTLNLTIDKPGIYPITMKYLNYLGGITVTHDSVLTVLAPSDVEDFAERKYIFKQDAEGVYCQLEGEGEVTLYDNVGRLVRTYQIQNERYIRKEDLERGVYFLQINVNGEVYHEKILVE